MSEHPTAGVGAPEQPTTQIPPQTSSAPAQQDAGEPQPESGGDAPTRAFAGFRTERRVPTPEHQQAAPPTAPRPGAMPPWDSTPVTGIPRVDPTAYGAYYAGRTPRPPRCRAPQRPEHLPHTPYPELSTGMLLRPVQPPPSDGWRLLLYKMSGGLINLGESPGPAATTTWSPR